MNVEEKLQSAYRPQLIMGRSRIVNLLLLMTILPKTLLTLVRGNFASLFLSS